MSVEIKDEDIEKALQHCAEEPVHIPGFIQSFGWMIAYSVAGHVIEYASENAADAIGKPVDAILGQHVREILGREIWHGVQNLISTQNADKRRQVVGMWHALDDGPFYLAAAWRSGDYVVVEFEEQSSAPLLSAAEIQTQSGLIEQAQQTEDVKTLLDISAKQLRYLTGFDRVMVYRFDQEWNGKVVAESHSRSVEPFLGLNFPSFDIPAQARAIMARIPLRLIADIEDEGAPIRAASALSPPLDISLGETRGTSPVHLQYLRNMGSQATMTLSVVIDGDLWGIISFHHRRPRLVSARMRIILRSFLDVFCLKLSLLIERRFKSLSEEVDQLHQDLQMLINTDPALGDLLDVIGGRLVETFDACGLFIKSEQDHYAYGQFPDMAIIEKLADILPNDKDTPYFSDHLSEILPAEMGADLNDVAGVAAVFHSNDWVLFIFRAEARQSISWAGDPQKTIEFAGGNARLNPRGSFSTFLAEQEGKCFPWTSEDRVLAQKLWPLLSAALNSEQRRLFMKNLNRQQELMIDEMNHRVRNILALVQAVSTEARRSQSSLQSYSKAIEARIRALAAAHSIGSGSAAKKVDIAEIILQEAKPYEEEAGGRVRVSGDRVAILSELAPIFALTIHELMTNAAKYGALSAPAGFVAVHMEMSGEDLEITWTETDGPAVETPERSGFGTTLIKRAVPYELGGESSLVFAPEGVRARIRLPGQILTGSDLSEKSTYTRPDFGEPITTGPVIPDEFTDGVALVIEDNFMIAEGVTNQLKGLGFSRVEAASSLEIAMEFLDDHTPSFAVLDVNLGQGWTSLPLAEVLIDRKVPFIFVTGYGELPSMTPRLAKQIVLTKPIDALELAHAIARTTP